MASVAYPTIYLLSVTYFKNGLNNQEQKKFLYKASSITFL